MKDVNNEMDVDCRCAIGERVFFAAQVPASPETIAE
jgi:hypothetical protein